MLKMMQIKVTKSTLQKLAETSFKERFRNHNKNFSHAQNRKSTELSKYMWSLKEEKILSRIRWSIAKKVYGNAKIDFCPLCSAEKVSLIEHFDDNRILNKRNEFICACRHQVQSLPKSFRNKKTV